MPKNLRVDTFPDPVGHFGAPWQPYWILHAVRRCRQGGVAGGERVPPSPLGWYYNVGFIYCLTLINMIECILAFVATLDSGYLVHWLY